MCQGGLFAPGFSYTVSYEATFESASLERARAEFWFATSRWGSGLAVGFDKRQRVAQRLNVRTSNPEGFIGGHEPIGVTLTLVTTFLDAVAGRLIAAEVNLLPGLGITSTRAVAAPELVARLGWRWLGKPSRLRPPWQPKVSKAQTGDTRSASGVSRRNAKGIWISRRGF